MYCFKCGSEIGNEDRFCPECGISQAPEVPQAIEVPQPLEAPQPPPQQNKSKKALWITLGSVAAVAIAAVAVYFLFFQNLGHMATIGRAFNNLGTEAKERIDNSPLKALSMLPEIMEDGTLTADVNYSYAILGDWLSIDMDANIKLSSNTKKREFALNAKINESNESIDFDLFVNKQSAALRVGLLDNNFYGITYDTFKDDIRTFGRLIGLDNETMDELTNMVEIISDAINSDENIFEADDTYSGIIANFARGLKTTSTSTHIEISGERVSCTAIVMIVTKNDIIKLLNDIYDMMENNDDFRSQFELFNTPMYQDSYGGFDSSYEYNLNEFKQAINEIEQNYFGDITFTFNIGKSDRLLSMIIDADLEIDGERGQIETTLNFGTSVNDTWTMIIHAAGDGYRETMSIHWLYDSQSGNHTNTIKLMVGGPSISLLSQWDENSGRFKLAYEDGWSDNGITGSFKHDGKSFNLNLDDLLADDSDSKLIIELSAKPGSEFKEVDFINIDKWGNTLIDTITDLLMGLIF